jgi:hypothetical protein
MAMDAFEAKERSEAEQRRKHEERDRRKRERQKRAEKRRKELKDRDEHRREIQERTEIDVERDLDELSPEHTRRDEYFTKLRSLEHESNALKTSLSSINGKIDDLDVRLADVPLRISHIREMNYSVLTHLERDNASISQRWADVGPSLRERVRHGVEDLRRDFNYLERELSERRGETHFEITRLQSVESLLGSLGSRVSGLDDDVSDTLAEFRSQLEGLERDLEIAESTVNLILKASFPWKEGESPIYSVEAKDMDNGIEGVVTLTSHRFIFESEKEVVLKKTLFFATEKKKIREVVFDQPIGIIDKIHKGKVGFWAGHGIFINFKSGSRLEEMKLDTKGHEADQMLRFFNFVISGEAERELSQLEDSEDVEEKERRPLVCGICGAPYTEEIYRGQTSVRCNYCGASITINR